MWSKGESKEDRTMKKKNPNICHCFQALGSIMCIHAKTRKYDRRKQVIL